MTSPAPLPLPENTPSPAGESPFPPSALPVTPLPVGTEVQTTGGWIRGVVEKGMLVWRNIPYAAPPVGELRFRAPRPVQRWAGFRPADKHGPVAPQAITGSAAGAGLFTKQSEDCLTLHITSRAAMPTKARPVLVFIHGGAYLMGSGSSWMYDGRELASDGDAVYVAINYRLGALGYMDVTGHGDAQHQFESNLGLRDQIAALQWVQDNIAAFGGDPDNVTIFGESAGGMAVTSLLASPAARGLFHRAIAQSPAPSLVNTQERAAEIAAEYVRVLREVSGASAPTSDAELLMTAPIKAIRKAQKRFVDEVPANYPGLSTTTCVIDGDLLPKHPMAAFADGSAADVPTIFGTNLDEGTLFYLLRMIPTRPEEIEPVLAASDPEARDRVVAAYPGYPDRDDAIRLGGDLIFFAPTVQSAQAHSRHAPTWMYRYDYSTLGLRWARLGAMHGGELPGIFGTSKGLFLRLLSFGRRRTLLKVGRRMRAHWLTMAASGEPGSGWPMYDEKTRKTMIFDATDRVENDPERVKREAWENFRYAV